MRAAVAATGAVDVRLSLRRNFFSSAFLRRHDIANDPTYIYTDAILENHVDTAA